MEWDSVNKIFWTPQPYPSWTKDIERAHWISPVGMPPELTEEQINETLAAGNPLYEYQWDEANQPWNFVTL